MRATAHILLLGSVWLCALSCTKQYDVCIYGGTSAGVVAAKSAAQEGYSVVIVEPSGHIGGLTTGGLGLTDIGNKQVVQGLSRQFYRELGKHYGKLESWVFEPHVAQEVMDAYLAHPRISVLHHTGLDRLCKHGTHIKGMHTILLDEEGRVLGRGPKILAKVFVDASYEGDLLPAAGVSYAVGRESRAQYGENWNGRHIATNHQFPDGVDPYVVPGDPASGLLPGITEGPAGEEGQGDSLLQAYNLRLCLTDSLENQIPLTKPSGYDSTRYELLARLIAAQPESAKYFIWSPMPGRKTDVNNYGGFSTDFIGGNAGYLEASYEGRYKIYQAHTDYTLGLLWFMMTDPRVPSATREELARWGLPKDEYPDNGNWTPQLYVREGRRMVSDYVVTQRDCEGLTAVPDGIAYAAYKMDSHNCRRIVADGMVKNEGNVEEKIPGPWPIPYRSIVPARKACDNLLVPVCVSASHIAFGSLRMEPVFMSLGQVAGLAAVMSLRQGIPVQDVSAEDLMSRLARDPLQDGSVPDLFMDDALMDVPSGWTRVKSKRGYGPSYLESSASGASVRFSARVPAPGLYEAYSYVNLVDDIEPVTHYDVAGTSVTVDSRAIALDGQMKGDWAPLGTFEFSDSVSVTVSGGNSGKPLRADCILLVKKATSDTLRILGVGNSWTRDALRYVSAIAASANRPVIVGHGYLGGSTLEDQWRGLHDTAYCYVHNGQPQKVHSTYQYWKYTASENALKVPSEGYENGLAGTGVKLEDIVADEPWDWIIFQPEATLGADFKRHLGQEPAKGYSLAALVEDVKGMMQPAARGKVRIGLMVPFSYPEGNKDYREKFVALYNGGRWPESQSQWDSLYRVQYQLIQQAAPLLCEGLSMDACVNVGKAVETCRQDPEFSGYGYKLQRSQDNTHLAEGLPKYVASLCFAYELLDIKPDEITYYPTDYIDSDTSRKVRRTVYKAICHD